MSKKQVTNADLAKAFKEAKRYLLHVGERPSTQYICFALDFARDHKAITLATLRVARGVIEERLGNHLTVNNWLRYHVPESRTFSGSIMPYRAAWLDALVKEFEEKEQ